MVRSARLDSRRATSRPLRHRRRLKRILDDAEDLLAPAFYNRLQPAELEASELNAAGHPDRPEAEVGEEIAREDRLVDEEALIRRLRLGIDVRERLERAGALVLRLADRRQEERLEHPRGRALDEIRARDEHGVVRGRAGRKLLRAREELGRAVLHRAEQAAVVVVVDRAPRAPLLLGPVDPALLVHPAGPARLPP